MIKWLVLSILISNSTQAAELFESNPSVRALGMGNAFTAIVSDKDSLFYNPAGLARVTGLNWTIADPFLGANGQDVYNAYKEMTDAGSSSSGFADQILTMFGKKLWISAGAKTALTVPYLGIAAYDAMSAAAYVSNPAYPNMNIRFINDYGVAGGFAFDLVPQILSMGFVGKKITRIGSAFPIGVSTLANLSSEDLQNSINNRGNGYSLDYGLNFMIPTPVKPTFSFVWKNLGYTMFTKDFGGTAPPMIKDEMIAGFGLTIDLPGLDIKPAVDFKYANRPEEQLGKKLHLGVEFDFPLVDVRGGFNQGYYTLGVGVGLGPVQLDVATYGVELGEYPGQHEDRRYLLQLSMELGFDPNLNFLKGDGNSGSSSKLKQRR